MYWMKHQLHGEGPVETMDEVKIREANGWVQAPYPGPNPPADAVTPDDTDESIFGGGGDSAHGDDGQQEQDTPPAPPAAIPHRGPGRPKVKGR